MRRDFEFLLRRGWLVDGLVLAPSEAFLQLLQARGPERCMTC